MFKHLPSLSQLRAFEASARYLSFTKAAEEIYLTQSAVSHQINSLEDLVKTRLFLRRNRRLILTEAGQELLYAIQKSLPPLSRTVEKLRSGTSTKKIVISTLPSIAGTWLMTKLGKLRTAFPDIDLVVLATETPDDFSTEETADIAIHFTHPQVKGLHQVLMMNEYYMPVCAPTLQENTNYPLNSPSDLIHHTLIHQDDTLGWDGWFEYHNISDITPEHLLSFNHGDLAIQAAIDAQGIAMVRALMVERAIEQKTLMPLFDMPLPARRKYYILTPHEKTENPVIMKVIQWLCEEAQIDVEKSRLKLSR